MQNKEMDKWIAENVMGWVAQSHGCVTDADTWFMYHDANDRPTMDCSKWHPTESISDAFQVVEKMRVTHFKWFEMAHRPNGYTCNFVGDPKYTEFAETAPLAICLAAKKALE